MYTSDLTVSSWVTISDECPMRHRVHDGVDVEFAFGSGTKTFEFMVARGALREFVGLATEALRELDAIAAGAEADDEHET